jgi:hypothetical protein
MKERPEAAPAGLSNRGREAQSLYRQRTQQGFCGRRRFNSCQSLHEFRHVAVIGPSGVANTGRIFKLKAGDVAILPVGTGYQCLSASDDFLLIGAYPPTGTYDEGTTVEDSARALKAIPKVALPRKDPVYGKGGPLSKLWKKAR